MTRKIPIYLKEPPDNLSIDFEEIAKFESLRQLQKYFKDEDICRDFLEQQRWSGEPRCPYCGADRPYRTSRGFKCRGQKCYQKFTVTVGTIYENTKAPLRVWFGVMYLAQQPLSSVAIAKKLRITQKTAWNLLKKMRDNPPLPAIKIKKVRKSPSNMNANNKRKDSQPETSKKNPDAVALGKLGGKKGGPARAEKLTAAQRSAIAAKGAEARWNDKEKPEEPPKFSQIDKDRLFNLLRREYLNKEIRLEELLKQMPTAGELLSVLVNEHNLFACITGKWSRFTEDIAGKGATLNTWIPESYWRVTLRQAVIYTLNKLHKEKNNLLFDETQEDKEEDEY